LALAIDIGVIALARCELQRAADAAALAAADELLDRQELTGAPDQRDEEAAARARAVQVAGANSAGGTALALDPNAANDPQGDVVVGYVADPANLASGLDANRTPAP